MTGYISVSAGDPKANLSSERLQLHAKAVRSSEVTGPAASEKTLASSPNRDDAIQPPQPLEDFAKLREQLRTMAEALPRGSSLVIDRDSDSGRFVYRFVDPKSGEVLRQFPADEVLERAASLREVTGAVVNNTA